MAWATGESGNPSGRKRGKLTLRQKTTVRSHIQATQLVKRLQDFALGRNDKQSKQPIEMSAHQVKAACYLISQAIGSPPQEIKADVNVNVRAQVHSIVAQYGEARARVALEALAPGLLAYLPSEGIGGELEAVDAELVDE